MISFVYKISCNDEKIKEIYIGSSSGSFNKRYSDHKYNCNTLGCPKYNTFKYNFIRDNGGFSNWKMEILEEYLNITDKELLKEETKYLKKYDKVLNKRLPIKFIEE